MPEDADDRGDALQDLVAGDQDTALLGVERGVFVRVPARHDHAEGAFPEPVALLVTQPQELLGHRLLASPDRSLLGRETLDDVGGTAMRHQEGAHLSTEGAAMRLAAPIGEEPFGARRLEVAIEAVDEPDREA